MLYSIVVECFTIQLYTLIYHESPQIKYQSMSTLCVNYEYTDFQPNVIFVSEGATGVEPMTYQTAADCSTIDVYTHVSLNIEYLILETTK